MCAGIEMFAVLDVVDVVDVMVAAMAALRRGAPCARVSECGG
jgi:hypothetical protein